jgi:biopolymer transport protein ExbB
MAWFLLAAVALSAWGAGLLSPLALAGEEKGAAAPVPAAAPAAAPEEGQVATPAGGEAAKEAPKVKPWLVWFLESSGLIGLFLLILSIYFVATVSRLFFELRLPLAVPPDVVSRGQELLQQKDFKGVFAMLKDDDSYFSKLVSTGIGELPNGLAEARDVMDRTAESLTVEMEKRISILAVLGTLGPMIGLLGTLKGMIASFSVIARSDVQMKASEVAGGISEALLITFEGVALSVPAIYFFSLFRSRVSVITTTATLEADQFLRHFAHAARAKGPAAGGATKVVQKAE